MKDYVMHAGHRPGRAGAAARWRRQGAAQTARNQLDGSSVRSAQPPPLPPASPLEADVPPSNHFASGKSERTDFGWGDGRRGRGCRCHCCGCGRPPLAAFMALCKKLQNARQKNEKEKQKRNQIMHNKPKDTGRKKSSSTGHIHIYNINTYI